ncbi:putative glycoside hydrolase family 93 protein [Rosellinia necatrix]|uniref:Putative glycoside hydrolase family 93 protein n=1 Tax=Rosellinia necatrix TaxID=77044 RepID=A0A1W2TWA6_ROSNE|nr:putative glycoside hydrolase family 93 protein [Rosellinia necatrix]
MLSVVSAAVSAFHHLHLRALAYFARRLPGRVVNAGGLVVIDSAGVYIRATATNDGGLLAGYAATDGNEHVLRVAKSADGGQSWRAQGEVYRADRTLHDVDNAFPLQLPGGRVLYAYRNHDRTAAGSQYTYYRITISYSDDGGVTFKYLSTVAERAAAGVNGLWEPFLRVANDGTLQCYYSAENGATDQDGFMKQSSDGGQTWSNPITVSGSGTTSRDGMIGVAKIDNNGNLMAVFENTEDGRFSIDSVRSHDDGRSWGERSRLYTAANGREAIAPQICNVGGTLVVSFMSDESVANAGPDGSQMKVVTSTNGGSSWSSAAVTGEVASHWPGLFARDSTHFLALYSKDGAGAVSQLYQLAN